MCQPIVMMSEFPCHVELTSTIGPGSRNRRISSNGYDLFPIYALHATPFSEIAIVSQLEQSRSARRMGACIVPASMMTSACRQHESIQRQLFAGETDDMENCVGVSHQR